MRRARVEPRVGARPWGISTIRLCFRPSAKLRARRGRQVPASPAARLGHPYREREAATDALCPLGRCGFLALGGRARPVIVFDQRRRRPQRRCHRRTGFHSIDSRHIAWRLRPAAAPLSLAFGAGHAAIIRKHRMRVELFVALDHPPNGVPPPPGKTSAQLRSDSTGFRRTRRRGRPAAAGRWRGRRSAGLTSCRRTDR